MSGSAWEYLPVVVACCILVRKFVAIRFRRQSSRRPLFHWCHGQVVVYVRNQFKSTCHCDRCARLYLPNWCICMSESETLESQPPTYLLPSTFLSPHPAGIVGYQKSRTGLVDRTLSRILFCSLTFWTRHICLRCGGVTSRHTNLACIDPER